MPFDRPSPERTFGAARTVAEGLLGGLAVTFQLYRDTHLAHFNVTGPAFPQLHALFEAQYRELWEAMDLIAERVRALGHPVAAEAFAAGGDDLPPDVDGLLRHLADGHRRSARAFLGLVDEADEAGDMGTSDLAIGRSREHEKHAWMLEATLG